MGNIALSYHHQNVSKRSRHKKLLHTYLNVARALHSGLFFADTNSHTPKGIKQGHDPQICKSSALPGRTLAIFDNKIQLRGGRGRIP